MNPPGVNKNENENIKYLKNVKKEENNRNKNR